MFADGHEGWRGYFHPDRYLDHGSVWSQVGAHLLKLHRIDWCGRMLRGSKHVYADCIPFLRRWRERGEHSVLVRRLNLRMVCRQDLNALAPVYVSELAPPKLRGLFVAMTGVILMVGQAIASFMGLAFYGVESSSATQWRGPLGIQILFPAITLVVAIWIPESPRWLLMHNRSEEAKQVVNSLHSESPEGQDFAAAEYYQMSRQAEFDRSLDGSWRACWTKKSYRRRFEMCCLYGMISQSTGLLVISAYGSVLYGTLGYSPKQQILFQCGYVTVAVVTNIVGDLIVDLTGRKILMMVGLTACVVWVSVEAAMVALYASPVPESPNRAGIAMAVAAL